MRLFEFDDMSYMCLFNIRSDSITVTDLVDCVENIFLELNYPIKKTFYSKNNRVYSPKSSIIKCIENAQLSNFLGLSFQSDYNKEDFEPNTRLYVDINLRYVNSKNTIKISIVVNDKKYLYELLNTYKLITKMLINNRRIILSGYSFLIPNLYNPVSFSIGILRKPDIPISLKNLASWYSSSDFINSTVGLVNCISNLTDLQNQYLKLVFGEDNVFIENRVTVFYNQLLNRMRTVDYLSSSNYNEICDKIEVEIPFKRLPYHKEL